MKGQCDEAERKYVRNMSDTIANLLCTVK